VSFKPLGILFTLPASKLQNQPGLSDYGFLSSTCPLPDSEIEEIRGMEDLKNIQLSILKMGVLKQIGQVRSSVTASE
jgi:hypothetical protein